MMVNQNIVGDNVPVRTTLIKNSKGRRATPRKSIDANERIKNERIVAEASFESLGVKSL